MTQVTSKDSPAEAVARVLPTLVRSSYLKNLNSSDSETVIYHSLFGNLHSVSQSYADILYLFNIPQNPQYVLADRSNPEKLQEVIDRFIENYFLVLEGFDERTLVDQELLDRRSRSLETGELINAVQLNISEGCNLKCTYCFADRVHERASAGHFAAWNELKFMTVEMAMESIEAVESLIRKNGGTAMVIKFFGREPLLNWPVVKAVIDRCEAVNDGFQFFYAILLGGLGMRRSIG
jgi:sulfatase maturation enzyme AslB (radical SAM superfamily)